MTQAALELQENAVRELLYLAKQNQKDITLKAPTGSGKTRMMANFMNAMLDFNSSVVFLVSTLSKGKLATQNYESFVELANACIYPKLKPFYISSGAENSKNTEYSLDIDTNANVYVLPTNQFTKSSRIYKERALLRFLQNTKESGKTIILIRDEAHITTNKLENELQEYFTQILHFSATPKDDKFDVEIKEREAEEAGLIKKVEWCGDSAKGLEEELGEALGEFKNLQGVYRRKGINPCCIIQISNENKAEQELTIITKAVEQAGLKWVCFVEKESGYSTNSALAKRKNKALWQREVKENTSFIDVVIFKMVITEGYDIPRACMLYQVRNSQSRQLDKQVIGRVRRNPALGYFEKLDSNTQEVFSRAFVYGVRGEDSKRREVRLKGGEGVYGSLLEASSNEIIREFQPFCVSVYNEVGLGEIDIESCLDSSSEWGGRSIFQAFREIDKSAEKVREKYGEYVRDFNDFCAFSANLEAIKKQVSAVVNDYERHLEVVEVGLRENVYSFYNESAFRFFAESWIWGSENDEVCLDSEAEIEWANILKKLAKECAKSIEINGDRIYLFGKNFIEKSNVKYEYYDTRKRVSYPDFIFKDKCDRVHIFEVKSVNKSRGQMIESDEYREKIERLKVAYIEASKKIGARLQKGPFGVESSGRVRADSNGGDLGVLSRVDSKDTSGVTSGDSRAFSGRDSKLESCDGFNASGGEVSEDFLESSGDSSGGKIAGYIFYIPIKRGDEWDIWCCENGRVLYENGAMNKAMFEKHLKQTSSAKP